MRRFGQPVDETDRALTFVDGEGARAVRVHVLLTEGGTVHTARLELPSPMRMRPETIFGWVARYNGNHVRLPELRPHTVAGGLRAWHFEGGWWAWPLKDEAGCIRGFKIWQEKPFDMTLSATEPEPTPESEGNPAE